MEYKILLGATKDGLIAFGRFELRNGPTKNDRWLSVSFDLVRPFNVEEFTLERVKDYLDSCFDTESKYNLCEEYECTPQELPEEFFDRTEIDEVFDCSLYPEEIKVGNNTYRFESDSCGQIDLTDELKEHVDKIASMQLIGLWQHFHLQNLSRDDFSAVNGIINSILARAKVVDEIEWISNYIKKNLEK